MASKATTRRHLPHTGEWLDAHQIAGQPGQSVTRDAVYLSVSMYANHVTARYGTLKGSQIASKNRSPASNDALLYCRQLRTYHSRRTQVSDGWGALLVSRHDAYRKMMGWKTQSIYFHVVIPRKSAFRFSPRVGSSIRWLRYGNPPPFLRNTNVGIFHIPALTKVSRVVMQDY